jgi:DNA primase
MPIAQSTIQQIQSAVDIVDVVSDFVSLKRKGTSWQACCPFHNEKTPSFSVAPAKGIFHCFGCHKAGNAVTFVMEIEKCSYPEALRYLAKKYHIEIAEEVMTDVQAEKQSLRESLLIALNFAKDRFVDTMKNTDEGQGLGFSYFKERGFNQQTIDKFELGYSKDDWQDLENAALEKGFSKEILEKAGLIIKKEETEQGNASPKPAKTYDRFRGRVMFPIHNLAGKVVGFGARTLKKDDKPKYLNSPETEVYIKNEILYGIYQAKTSIRNTDECFLTEGYTDVISLHQNGIENVVASSGTALTDNQIRLIKRFTDNITVLYDGDSAGVKAALRGIDLLLAQGMNVKAVVFPDSEDPDSYAKKVGGEAFRNYIASNAKDFITFKTELYLKEIGNDPVKKAGVIRNIVESISKIPDSIKRAVFFKQTSQLLAISEDILIAESNKILIGEQKKADKLQETQSQVFATELQQDIIANELTQQTLSAADKDTIEKIIGYQEKESTRLLLRYGQFYINEEQQLWQYLFAELVEINFHTPVYKEILQLYQTATNENITADVEYLMAKGSPEVQTMVSHLLWEKYNISENWYKMYGIFIPQETDILPNAVYSNILRLKHRIFEQMIDENLKSLDKGSTEENELQVLQTHLQLTKTKNEIAKILGSVVTGWKS